MVSGKKEKGMEISYDQWKSRCRCDGLFLFNICNLGVRGRVLLKLLRKDEFFRAQRVRVSLSKLLVVPLQQHQRKLGIPVTNCHLMLPLLLFPFLWSLPTSLLNPSHSTGNKNTES